MPQIMDLIFENGLSKYVAVNNTIIFKENFNEYVGPIANKNKHFHSIITIKTM